VTQSYLSQYRGGGVTEVADDVLRKFRALIFKICILVCFNLAFISVVSAEKVSYIYDDLGRLIKAVSETGEVAIYSYDAVGNLLSISNRETEPSPPVLNSITPDNVFAGETLSITIEGKNLLNTEKVSSDNSGISINNFSSTDTTITANITVSSTPLTGPSSITIKTAYGSASIPINIAKLIFIPDQATITPNAAMDITTRIEGLSGEYTLLLNNQNPDIISAPQSITIPAGDNTIFTINALKEGTGVITAKNTGVSVYVSQAFTGNAFISSTPVNVLIGPVLAGGFSSKPVGVRWPLVPDAVVISRFVNVEWPFLDGGFSSKPVGVQWPLVPDAIVVSGLVCVKISNQ